MAIAIDRDLAPKFRPVEARTAQLRPKDVFGASHLFAEGAGELPAM
jgi:hypothetical protein